MNRQTVNIRSKRAWIVCIALLLSCFGCSAANSDPPSKSASDRDQINDAPRGDVPQLSRGTIASGDIAPQTVENLRTQVASEDQDVRAEAIRRLGEIKDVDSFPTMLDAMEDASPTVRQNAFDALSRLTNLRVPFDAEGSSEDRRTAVAFYRDFWEEHKDPNGVFMQVSKNPSLKYTKYGQKNKRQTAPDGN